MGHKMTRGLNQTLYKYLPEMWIDFSASDEERIQYIAQVDHWNSINLENVNKERLLRKVNDELHAFERASAGSDSKIVPLAGFGPSLLKAEECSVLTPKDADTERGVIAKLSPLTFYCKECKRVYHFSSPEKYYSHRRCSNPKCKGYLAQFRQVFFCSCGSASDKIEALCPTHGRDRDTTYTWDGGFNFICDKCKKKIPIFHICDCGARLPLKPALDPSQMVACSLTLIDLIDEETENFLSHSENGIFLTVARWLNQISSNQLSEFVYQKSSASDEEYQKQYDSMYQTILMLMHDENAAREAAKNHADKMTGGAIQPLVDTLRADKITCSMDNLKLFAESYLEYGRVCEIKDVSDLSSAAEVAAMLNTNSNPDAYPQIAKKYGITNAFACGSIPLISCTYGYTRGTFGYTPGAQLRALKQEKPGKRNVYAAKLTTEGVVFEFDRVRILRWLLVNGTISQQDMPDLNNEEEVKLWFINNVHLSAISTYNPIASASEPITAKVYTLIHSLSHLLLRAAAEIGGLGKDSMKEYLFPAIPAVLIYCSNSQGYSLGTMFNTFETSFDRWMKRAFDLASKCVYDPICMERSRACTGCLFVNEISCQHFNKDLDRALVVGRYDRLKKETQIGFWGDY